MLLPLDRKPGGSRLRQCEDLSELRFETVRVLERVEQCNIHLGFGSGSAYPPRLATGPENRSRRGLATGTVHVAMILQQARAFVCSKLNDNVSIDERRERRRSTPEALVSGLELESGSGAARA